MSVPGSKNIKKWTVCIIILYFESGKQNRSQRTQIQAEAGSTNENKFWRNELKYKCHSLKYGSYSKAVSQRLWFSRVDHFRASYINNSSYARFWCWWPIGMSPTYKHTFLFSTSKNSHQHNDVTNITVTIENF